MVVYYSFRVPAYSPSPLGGKVEYMFRPVDILYISTAISLTWNHWGWVKNKNTLIRNQCTAFLQWKNILLLIMIVRIFFYGMFVKFWKEQNSMTNVLKYSGNLLVKVDMRPETFLCRSSKMNAFSSKIKYENWEAFIILELGLMVQFIPVP